jgi:hypothetical protein
MKLKGGGGTDVQKLFDWLDSKLVKSIDGVDHFVFDDNMDFVEKDKKKAKKELKNFSIKQKLKPQKEGYKEPSFRDKDLNVNPGEFVVKEGGFQNVPLLIIYTDGYFTPPNISKSKLFGANPGNVMYIVTDRNGIENIRPKNFVFHEL